MSKRTRLPGKEMQTAKYLINHPRTIAASSGLGTAVTLAGPEITGSALGVTAVIGAGWYRAHPSSFDRVAGPRIRAWRRRWFGYQRRWSKLMFGCELVSLDMQTGETRMPKLVGVKSISPSQDILEVKLPRKVRAQHFIDAVEDLIDQLKVERIAVEKTGPARLRMLVERTDPFDEIVPAPEIPEDTHEVDLSAVEVGQNEDGTPYRHPVVYAHTLVSGSPGSGKGSFIWDVLRGIGPAITDGTVRVHMIDPKGLMETIKGKALFTSHVGGADDSFTEIKEQLEKLRNEMKTAQAGLRKQGKRKFTPSLETPLELIVIDEIAALLMAPGTQSREIKNLLLEILTQGRACGYAVIGAVQEPTKENVIGRELFTHRVCLRVTTDSQVDMVLGEGARKAGATADLIPPGDEFAGQGFVLAEKARTPRRIRLGWSSDEDIDELVTACAPPATGEAPHLVAV